MGLVAQVSTLIDAVLASEVGAAALGPTQRLERVRALEEEARAELAFLARKAVRDQRAVERRLLGLEQTKAEIKAEVNANRRRFW